MKITEIKKKAEELGVIAGKMKKGELIQAIQKAEGYNPCFGSGSADCPWTECAWRSDCVR